MTYMYNTVQVRNTLTPMHFTMARLPTVRNKSSRPKRKGKSEECEQKINEIFCRRIVTFEESLNQDNDPTLRKICRLLKTGKIEDNERDELNNMGIKATLLWRKRAKVSNEV